MVEMIIIVAVAQNGVIGRQGKLPWHLPSDLKHFKKTTMHHPVIMGRKTFESIGKPLPGRENLILTRDPAHSFPGCTSLQSLQQLLDYCRNYPKAFIIGGGEVFRLTLPITDTIILTALERAVEGDVFFPPIDPESFRRVSVTHYQQEEPYDIIHYRRIAPKPC